MPVFERLNVVAQLAVAAHRVGLAVLVGQHRAQPTLLDQFENLRLQVLRVAGEVLQFFARCILS